MKTTKHGLRFNLSALSLLAIIAAPVTLAAATDNVVRAVEGFSSSVGERGGATTQQLKEQRTAVADITTKPRGGAASAAVTLGEHWIYDADAVLFDDFDDDGYSRFISVRIDADTIFADAYVYAVLYLSDDGEVWEEYYATQDFLISGTTSDDEYFVETELVAGFPPGLYDVLIELYDADFGTFVDEFGPVESSALSLLALEDASFDEPAIAVTISSGHGGGGATSWLLLPGLLLALALRGREWSYSNSARPNRS